MLRGRLICVIGTTPKRGDVGVVLGKPKTGVLVALNAETLNWIWWPSRMTNARVRLASNCGAEWRRMFGLRTGVTRKVSGGRCTQSCLEVLNQWSSVWPLLSFGSQ